MRGFDGMLPPSSSRGVPPSDVGSICIGFSVGSVYIGVCMAFVGGDGGLVPYPPPERSKKNIYDIGVQKKIFWTPLVPSRNAPPHVNASHQTVSIEQVIHVLSKGFHAVETVKSAFLQMNRTWYAGSCHRLGTDGVAVRVSARRVLHCTTGSTKSGARTSYNRCSSPLGSGIYSSSQRF